MTPKSPFRKEIHSVNWASSTFKTFALQRPCQATELEKIFVSHTHDKGLTSRIHKEHSKLKSKNRNNSISGQNI